MQRVPLITSRSFVLATLVLANIVTIFFFIIGHGSMMQVLWTYWLQSIIIGAAAVVRMLLLSGVPRIVRVYMSGFFCLHYGGFHVLYALFLSFFSQPHLVMDSSQTGVQLGGDVQAAAVLVSGLFFSVHHFVSLAAERRVLVPEAAIPANPAEAIKIWNKYVVLGMKEVFSRPYVRIIPMHLIIILGPLVALAMGNSGVFVVFMGIKTIVDVSLFVQGVSHPQAAEAKLAFR